MTETEMEKFASKNNEDVYEAMSVLNDKKRKTLSSLLLGMLAKLYSSSAETHIRNATFIADDGKHTCDVGKCRFKLVECKVYFFQPTRVHLCLDGCKAGPTFHKGFAYVLSDSLYACDTSGKPHICTFDLCDATQQEFEGRMVCTLTGKCVSDAKLSNGWIDDNWRPQYFRPASKRQKLRQRGETGTFLSKDKYNMHVLSFIPDMKDMVATLEYHETYKKIIQKVYEIIRPLFPGHKDRDILDVGVVLEAMDSVVNAWYRHSKRCVLEDRDICMTDLYLLTQSDMYLLQPRNMVIEPQTMDMICHAHSRHVTKFLVTLFKHTDIDRYDLTLTDFVLSMLYLQRGNFKVSDVKIISVDLFLEEYLPNAFHLGRISSISPNAFTSTKTAIRASILAANERGVNLSLLVYPSLKLSDILI